MKRAFNVMSCFPQKCSHTKYQDLRDHTLNTFTDMKPNSALILTTSNLDQCRWKIPETYSFHNCKQAIIHKWSLQVWVFWYYLYAFFCGVRSWFGSVECDLYRVASCALKNSGHEKCCFLLLWVYLFVSNKITQWDLRIGLNGSNCLCTVLIWG